MIVILNCASGTAAATEDARAQIERAFEKVGLGAEVVCATSGDQLCAVAKRAADGEHETVVAAGGDGTVSAVAGCLAGTSKRFGVLAMGTLNHFAKDIRMPLDLDLAALTLARGRETLVDVGEVNGCVFLNNSSIGLYPRIVRHRDQQRERLGRGKWPAFAWAALSALRIAPLLKMRILMDGRELVARSPFLFVGNNAYHMDGVRVGARDRVDEGLLSVYFAHGARGAALTGLALRSLLGRLKQAKNFESYTARELRVELREPLTHVSTDGEVRTLRSPLNYRIRPRALRVIVPEEVGS